MLAWLGRNKAEVSGFVLVGLNAASGAYAAAGMVAPFWFTMLQTVGSALCLFVLGQRSYEKAKS